jgi:transcriptional regulator with XRE-family HTH domain
MERLREARIRAQMSKTALAKAAGINRGTVVRAEQGIPINEISQERIARALGIDRRELFPEPQEAAS